MELTLFVVFFVLSLLLIALGLFKSDHTELSLVGFLFLFLLAMIMIQGTIQYKTGETYGYGCLCCGPYESNQTEIFGAHNCTDVNNSSLVVTSITDNYTDFDSGSGLSHIVGYWLAIASIVGFIGIMFSFRRLKY
jgi:hypothetical protein